MDSSLYDRPTKVCYGFAIPTELQHFENTDEVIVAFKSIGVSYYLGLLTIEETHINNWVYKLCQWIPKLDNAINEPKQYINKNYKFVANESASSYTVYMQLYESKEYQTEVERILKTYCKGVGNKCFKK